MCGRETSVSTSGRSRDGRRLDRVGRERGGERRRERPRGAPPPGGAPGRARARSRARPPPRRRRRTAPARPGRARRRGARRSSLRAGGPSSASESRQGSAVVVTVIVVRAAGASESGSSVRTSVCVPAPLGVVVVERLAEPDARREDQRRLRLPGRRRAPDASRAVVERAAGVQLERRVRDGRGVGRRRVLGPRVVEDVARPLDGVVVGSGELLEREVCPTRSAELAPRRGRRRPPRRRDSGSRGATARPGGARLPTAGGRARRPSGARIIETCSSRPAARAARPRRGCASPSS